MRRAGLLVCTWLLMSALVACAEPERGASSAGTSPATRPAEASPPASVTEPAQAVHSFTLVAWNLESGDSDDATLFRYVDERDDAALWGFSELHPGSAPALERALGGRRLIVGSTGADDRLALAIDERVFALLGSEELHDINALGRVRAPLVARTRHRESGREILFVVNHLYRSREAQRHWQAEALNRWARAQGDVAIIAVGDYNFDWAERDGARDHDRGYDLMTEGGVFRWAQPSHLVRTQCGSHYRSILDFVFLAGAAQRFAVETTIEGGSAAFCPGDRDDARSSDHRPITATVTVR